MGTELGERAVLENSSMKMSKRKFSQRTVEKSNCRNCNTRLAERGTDQLNSDTVTKKAHGTAKISYGTSTRAKKSPVRRVVWVY